VRVRELEAERARAKEEIDAEPAGEWERPAAETEAPGDAPVEPGADSRAASVARRVAAEDVGEEGARERARASTALRPPDPESSASAVFSHPGVGGET
jgi:hypothetical protein